MRYVYKKWRFVVEKFTKEELKDFIIGLSVVAFCLFCCLLFKINRNVWHGTDDTDYTLYATFNKTDGLVVGDKVRLAGVDIGRVVDSVLDNNYRAVLSLKINSKILLPTDSSASIVSSGIMGGKYIEIEPGGEEEFFSDGDEFNYTQDAMVLQELVDRVISLGKAKRNKNNVE